MTCGNVGGTAVFSIENLPSPPCENPEKRKYDTNEIPLPIYFEL